MTRIATTCSVVLLMLATSVVAQAPAPAADAYVGALTLHLAGRHDEAMRRAAAAPQAQSPWARDAMAYVRARSAAGQGKSGEAISRLTRLCEATPGSALVAEARLDLARFERLRGGTDAAIAQCKVVRSLKVSPRVALAALLEQGLAQERGGKFDQAVVSFNQLQIEAGRLSEDERRRLVVRRFAAQRQELLLSPGADMPQAIAQLRKAQRQARHSRSRNQALLELIGLASIHVDSPLVDDSLVERVRICLLKGDNAAAHQTFGQLLNGHLSRLGDEPLRACSLTMARWLLTDADRRIASLADVFPELFGYASGQLAETPRLDGTVAHTITFRRSNASFRLALNVVVARPREGETPTHPALDLVVTTSVETGSAMLKKEIGTALDVVLKNLDRLERAAEDTLSDGGAVNDDPQAPTTETPSQ